MAGIAYNLKKLIKYGKKSLWDVLLSLSNRHFLFLFNISKININRANRIYNS